MSDKFPSSRKPWFTFGLTLQSHCTGYVATRSARRVVASHKAREQGKPVKQLEDNAEPAFRVPDSRPQVPTTPVSHRRSGVPTDGDRQRLERTPPASSRTSPEPPRREFPRTRQYSRSFRRSTNNHEVEVLCLNCKKIGHFASRCPLPLSQEFRDWQQKFMASATASPQGNEPLIPPMPAQGSLINIDIADSLGLHVRPCSARLEAANGQPLAIRGTATATVFVDGQTFVHPFIVIPHLETEKILLGNDFLEATQDIIDWGKNTFQVTAAPRAQRVCLMKQVVVPPRSRKIVSAQISAQPHDQIISVTKLFTQRYNLDVASMRVEVGTKCLHVVLVNPAYEPVMVPARATVGCAEPVQEVEDVPLSDDVAHIFQCLSPEDVDTDTSSAPIATVQSPQSQTVSISDVSFNAGADLSAAELSTIRTFLTEHLSSFARTSTDVGSCRVQTHAIPTRDVTPIAQLPRRLSPAQRDLVKAMINDLIDAGLLRPTRSAWASPLVLVKIKDGSTHALAALTGAKFFSVMDLASGFHQIPMCDQDIEKTAFITPWGLYEYLRMPFGLKGAPFTCQRAVDAVIDDAKFDYALVYMDDSVVYSKTFDEHLEHLSALFSDLKFKPQKCFFCCSEILGLGILGIYLGYVVTRCGISPDPAKIAAVQRFPQPSNIKDLQSFLGLTSYFRKFTPRYSTEVHSSAFCDLKEALCSPPVLKLFSDDASFAIQVHTDASKLGLGALLLQEDEDRHFRPVVYLSRALKGAEANYSSTELEALAVKWSLEQLRPYLLGRKFQIVTDHHALCWLLKYKEGNQRLLRCSLSIQEFDLDVIYKTGRLHYAPDCLSRAPLIDTSCPVLQVTDSSTPDDVMSTEQQSDTFCQHIISLLNGVCGTRKQQRRTQRKFVIHSSVLYKVDQGPVHHRFLMCLPRTKIDHVLHEFHGGKYGAHMGVRRTYEAIRTKYYWPTMFSDVNRYVRHCDLCQRYKLSSFSSGLLLPILVHSPLHVTRAIDHELTSDMTAQTFLLAFRRFGSRRGVPSTIFSDNAKTFRYCSKVLRALFDNSVQDHASSVRIQWKFIAEWAPGWGGFREGLIRTIKDALKRCLRRSSLCYDELFTVLLEVEAAVNCRPLTQLADETEDCEALTPSYFLIGRRAVALPASLGLEVPSSTPAGLRRRVRHRQALLQQL
ncbi:uncharacterized protein LOC135392436 [Ornithodoros turicata]|uniref:uncharacterized protein LOC135392436 n=1 Tax=Ornithodoros turicata TaxID=34597 RepID=UPI003138B793